MSSQEAEAGLDLVPDEVEEVVEAPEETPTLEQMPIHVLRSKLKDEGIQFKTTDKKPDLIKMLETGETIHKPEPVKKAPKLEDHKKEKALPVVPKEIRPLLEAMRDNDGLRWEIDEEACCINFTGRLTTCANLDQPATNILKTAQQALAKGATLPAETGREGIK